eukprot:scaffold16017_cov183-Amphora_coffeaeformis.AAC.5
MSWPSANIGLSVSDRSDWLARGANLPLPSVARDWLPVPITTRHMPGQAGWPLGPKGLCKR